MTPRVITRDSIFKNSKGKKNYTFLTNLPKHSTQGLFDLVDDKSSIITLVLSRNIPFAPHNHDISEKLTTENITLNNTLSMNTTLSRIEEHLGWAMNCIFGNSPTLEWHTVIADIANLSLLYNQINHINEYTSVKLNNSIIILDTGDISLWENQQDLLLSLLDKEWQHFDWKRVLSKFKEHLNEYLSTNIISRIDVKNSTIDYSTEWPSLMKVGSYSFGKSYPLLATVKNSPYTNRVVIVTNDAIEAYHWTRYCNNMKMAYCTIAKENMVSDKFVFSNKKSKLSKADSFTENEIENNETEVIIFPSLTDYISLSDRTCMQNIKRCIIDLPCLNLIQDYYAMGIYLKEDEFEIIYQMHLPLPLVIPKDNCINTIIEESLIIPPTNMRRPSIKINNINLLIRKKQLCSIILLHSWVERDDGGDFVFILHIFPSLQEKEMRIKLNLPSNLRMCQSANSYLENVKGFDLRIDEYQDELEKINSPKCSICHLGFSTAIRIIYECCCTTCCLNCYNSNVQINGTKGLDCFMCNTINPINQDKLLNANDYYWDYSYLKTIILPLNNLSRILIVGHFFQSDQDGNIIKQCVKNWFSEKNHFFNGPYPSAPPKVFDIMALKNMDVQVLKYCFQKKPMVMVLDTREIQTKHFKPYHFENITTVLFLPSTPLVVKQIYMSSLGSSNSDIDVYHLKEN